LYNSKPATLGNSRARSTIIHRTVWCVTGLSGEPAEQWLPVRQQLSAQRNSACQKSERRSQRAPDCPVWYRTVRCSKTTKTPTVDQLRTLTVALTWRAPDSAQWLFGGAPDCPVRPSPVAFTNGYGTPPNHLIHIYPSISKFSFIAIAKAQHSKTQSKQSIHSKPQNQL
jgi:hypothetical protein